MEVQLLQCHLFFCGGEVAFCWKDHGFSIELPFHLCKKSAGHISVVLFLDSVFCIDLCCVPSLKHTCLDYCNLIVSFKIRYGYFDYYFQNCFSYSHYFVFSHTFWYQLLNIYKSIAWILIGIMLMYRLILV